MQHSEQKNIKYERVCVCVYVCTCSHESCHVPALLLKRQFDWLMSKGKATCDDQGQQRHVITQLDKDHLNARSITTI